jgi:hypothetical protein
MLSFNGDLGDGRIEFSENDLYSGDSSHELSKLNSLELVSDSVLYNENNRSC